MLFSAQDRDSKAPNDDRSDTVGAEKDVEATPVAPVVGAIDPVIEQRVRRKLDLHLVPLVAALYLLAFLDRSNIG